ncbi:MAG: sorting protein, partial [Prosthecobacter sp.]|nr:sorting protein [Prosthecobacter sp.]
VTNGQLSPGDVGGVSEGTLSFASGLTFNHATPSTAAVLTIQGSTTANETGDHISITGILSLGSNSTFAVTNGANWSPTLDQSWTLLDWTGVLTLNGWSSGSNLSLPDLSSYGLGWDVSSLVDGSTGGALVITVVPEPSRAMLLLAALAFAFLRRRRLC